MQKAQTILERQLQAFQLQGNREYPMVSLKNIYNSLSKIIENAGLKNVENYFVNPDMGKGMVTPPPEPPLTPIEKIEFRRIASEEQRKIAELEIELKKVKSQNAEILYENEIKLKELELKYNAQLDSQQIKADADLNKMLVAESTNDFRKDKDQVGKLQKEVSQANKAKQLFENPLLKESFDKLKKLYANSLFNTGAKETEAREKLWLAYNVVGKVEQNLLEMIDTGKLATKQLEDYRKSIKNQKF